MKRDLLVSLLVFVALFTAQRKHVLTHLSKHIDCQACSHLTRSVNLALKGDGDDDEEKCFT